MTESHPQGTSATDRAPYSAPVLDELGAWSTLTLQQTVPISPDVEATELDKAILLQSF